MAKLKGLPRKGKTPSFNKNVVIQVSGGQAHMQTWPKKRGKPKSPVTQEQNEWFKEANLLAKYADGAAQWMAIEVAKNGPWYPRDLLMSAMAGRLFESIIIDGQEYRSVAVRDDVSSDLDFLAGTEQGTIIVRGPDLWSALTPGLAGNILTSNGTGLLPSYQAGAAAGGKAISTAIPAGTVNARAEACQATVFRAIQNFQIDELGSGISGTAGDVLRGYVFRISQGGLILELMGETADVIGGGGLWLNWNAPLISPATIVAGTIYAIAFSRRDGADTFVLPILDGISSFNMVNLPLDFARPYVAFATQGHLAKAQPAVSDTFALTQNSLVYCRVTFTV